MYRMDLWLSWIKSLKLTWLEIRLKNAILGFFRDFGIISFGAQNHGLGPKICKYVLWHQKQSCRGWNLDQFCHQGQPSSIFGSKVMGRQSLTYFLAPNWERRPFGTIFHCHPKKISIGCQSDNFDPRRSAHGSSESLCPKFSETHVEMVSIFKILGASPLRSQVILAPNWERQPFGTIFDIVFPPYSWTQDPGSVGPLAMFLSLKVPFSWVNISTLLVWNQVYAHVTKVLLMCKTEQYWPAGHCLLCQAPGAGRFPQL